MSSPAPTLIKQKGDTIYFKNGRTQNSWQILYNFACAVGQSWQTTVLQKNGNPITYTYVVDSVAYVIINGFTLKRLKVSDPVSGSIYITERFGSAQFLFNYNNSGIGGCDGDYFQSFLCYTDNSFGTKVFGAKPCDYSNLTGVSTLYLKGIEILVYPNPTSGQLHLCLAGVKTEKITVIITNALGQNVFSLNSVEQSQEIDLSGLATGIYFLKFQDNSEQKIFRIIKE